MEIVDLPESYRINKLHFLSLIEDMGHPKAMLVNMLT